MSDYDATPYGVACGECGRARRIDLPVNTNGDANQKAAAWIRCRCGHITPGVRGRSGEQVRQARQNHDEGAFSFVSQS